MGEPPAAVPARAFADRVVPVVQLVFMVVVLVQAGLAVPTVFVGWDVHRPAWAAGASFAMLVAVTAVSAVWVLRGRRLPGAVAMPATVMVLVAGSMATTAMPSERYFGNLDWSFGLVGWYLLLLLVDRVPVLLVAMGVHVVASVVQFVTAGSPDRSELGPAGTVLLSVAGFQLAVAVVVWMLRRRAVQAGEVAAERDRLVLEQALAEQRKHDYRLQFADGLGATLPLLAGLADGTLDPRSAATRGQLVLAAARLRRLFAENDDVPDPLVHELSACIDIAERRGVSVSLAVSGVAVPVPMDVRRELTEPVLAALAVARTHARVSLLRTGDEVSVAVVADAELAEELTVDGGRVEVKCQTYGLRMRMEATWPTESAGPTPPS